MRGIEVTKKQETNSTEPSNALERSWEKQLKALDARLRASGFTVKVQEPSDTDELLATFPPPRPAKL
jgi:hypothetical protein